MNRLNKLFKKNINIDIKSFKVTQIDYCFNIETEYVSQYIILFNNIFLRGDNKHHINFVLVWRDRFSRDSSFYVKTKSQYKNRENKSYTVNFYNKQNQLIYRRNKAFIDNVKTNITLDDIEEAKNILRLEVKCKYNYLKKICEKFNIDNRTRQFQDLFKLQIAKYVITDKYLQFFKYGKAHFCSYKKAKEIAKNDFKLKAFILKISQGRIINNYERNTQGKKLLAMDINPLGFINDLKQGILYNPLILLDQKLDDLKK